MLFFTIVEGFVSDMTDFSVVESYITEAAFSIIFGLSFFLRRELNNSFSNFEKGTSTSIVPINPKQRLINAIPK